MKYIEYKLVIKLNLTDYNYADIFVKQSTKTPKDYLINNGITLEDKGKIL